MMNNNLKAVAYCRVSTIVQEEGRSLEFQVKKCQDFCELKGYDLIEVIEDVESGGNDKREGFLLLLDKIKNKEFNVLVVYESSRISRVTLTMLNFVLELQKSNIHFVSISQPELNTTTPTGMLFFQIQATLSEYERSQISLRVKSNKWARAKEGIWQGGKLPIGYKKDPVNNDIILVDEENAQIVKDMFHYFISCRSLQETANLFNKHSSSIRWILSNDFYIGKFRYGKKENNINTGKIILHEDYKYFASKHNPIIDQETFNLAQTILNLRQRKVISKISLLFGGIIKCTCGAKLYSHKNSGGLHYRCDNCGKSISARKIHPVIFKELFKLSELEDLNNANIDLENKNKEILILKNSLKSYEKEKDRCKHMFRKGHLTEKELDTEMEELNSKINSIKYEINILNEIINNEENKKVNTDNLKLLKEVLENMEENDVVELKNMFRLLIDHIDFISRNPLTVKIFLR